MKSNILFMNIYQILSSELATRDQPSDFNRECRVHVSSNSVSGEYKYKSHITLEFEGQRAKFFCALTFDGSGDLGTGLGSFTMPKQKLTYVQKSLVLLSVIEYLGENDYLQIDFDFMLDKVSAELDGGIVDLRGKYAMLCRNSRNYIEAKEKGAHIIQAQ